MDFSRDEWILLLDDDTTVTEDYFKIIFSELQLNTNITAYCPLIFEGKSKFLQQLVILLICYFRKMRESIIVILLGYRVAFLIKMNFLKKIGGFNKKFPLDYLDHWLFYQLVDKEKKK